MSNLYRFKYRSEEFEIELESHDQKFIDQKIAQFKELLFPAVGAPELAPSTAVAAPAKTKMTAKTKGKAKPEAEQKLKTEAKLQKEKAKPEKPAKGRPKKEEKSKEPSKEVAAIVAFIKKTEHGKAIQQEVFSKTNQLNRILHCFYFGEKAFPGRGLTTGEVEAITEILGKPIKSTNVGSQMKKEPNLFIGESTGKRGIKVFYQISEKGKAASEKLIKENAGAKPTPGAKVGSEI